VRVRAETQGAAALVIPEGRLDFGAAAAFQRDLERALAQQSKAVIVDCAALDYVSSAGLRAFLQAARAAQRARTAFVLCALKPVVREVFELSGFNRIITVHADRAAALAAALPEAAQERRMSVAGETAELPALTRFLQEFWGAAGLPPAQALPFELALEELFMNVVMHGSAAGSMRKVDLSLALGEQSVTMILADDGPEFDPLKVPAPDVTLSLEERRVGGNGVFLVRQMMDAVAYRRSGSRNELTLTKQITR
jgi:serine/threonine-protein kinase RsbW